MIADKIPTVWRGRIYVALATLLALETVWDFVDDGLETKLLGTAAALGFVLARANTHAEYDEGVEYS